MGSVQSKIGDAASLAVTASNGSSEELPSHQSGRKNCYTFTFTIPVPSIPFPLKSSYVKSPIASLPTTISKTVDAEPLPEREEYFRFLDLPLEIRFMIYEEVLVVGKVFYTPSDHDLSSGDRCKDYKLFRKPELQLLRVCKQTHVEAEPIYLAKNLFVFPIDWFRHFPFVHEDIYKPSPPRFLFSEAGRSLMENASFGVDVSTFRGEEYYSNHHYWTRVRREWDGLPFAELSPQERFKESHEWAIDGMKLWDFCVQSGFHRLRNRMEYLELDFTNAFCFLGECRPLLAFDIKYWLHILQPSTLVVKGLYSRNERKKIIANACPRSLSYEDITNELVLRSVKGGKKIQWDAHKMGALDFNMDASMEGTPDLEP